MKPALLSPQEMPSISGLNTPVEFYVPTIEPVLLAGMRYPKPSTPWQALYQAGFRHVVRLENERPGYDPSPLNLLHTAALEDLIHAREPKDPHAEERLVREAVRAVLSAIELREGVIVHCVGGTGRTGTVLGCTLVAFGHPATQVLTYLDQLNISRGKKGWPESHWQAELVSRFSRS